MKFSGEVDVSRFESVAHLCNIGGRDVGNDGDYPTPTDSHNWKGVIIVSGKDDKILAAHVYNVAGTSD